MPCAKACWLIVRRVPNFGLGDMQKICHGPACCPTPGAAALTALHMLLQPNSRTAFKPRSALHQHRGFLQTLCGFVLHRLGSGGCGTGGERCKRPDVRHMQGPHHDDHQCGGGRNLILLPRHVDLPHPHPGRRPRHPLHPAQSGARPLRISNHGFYPCSRHRMSNLGVPCSHAACTGDASIS